MSIQEIKNAFMKAQAEFIKDNIQKIKGFETIVMVKENEEKTGTETFLATICLN